MERQVAFQTLNGQYLEVDLPGDCKIWAEHGSRGAGSIFTIIDQGTGSIAIKAHNGKYVTNSGSVLVAASPSVGKSETFKMIDQGAGLFAIQTNAGTYVCAEGGGGSEVVSNRKNVGPWEKFKIVDLPAFDLKRIKLRTAEGKYVVTSDGSVLCATQAAGVHWRVVPQPGGLVALQSPAGKYVTIQQGTEQKLAATAERVSERERFRMQTYPGGKVALSTLIWQFVVQNADGTIALGRYPSPEMFTVEIPPSPNLKRVALRSHNGKYVSVNHDGKLSVTGTTRGAGEVFRIVHSDAGTVALETCEGKYWSAEGGDVRKIIATPPWILEFERFRWVDQGPGKASMIACNGKYVCAENGGGGDLIANRIEDAAWETFQVETILSVNDLKISDLVRYAPVVYFHPDELYPPMSIETLIQASKLDKAGVELASPLTQTDLAVNRQEERFLAIDQSIYRKGKVADAPMYVVPQIAWDGSFIDLNFFYLHAYNGPQSISIAKITATEDGSLHNFAEHQGDLEGMSVRVKPDFSEIVFIRYEVHGDSTFYLPPQVKMIEGKHPVALAAINSHCTYNMQDLKLVKGGTVSLDSYTALGAGVHIRDFVVPQQDWNEKGSYALRPYSQSNNVASPNGKLVVAGVDSDGEPVNEQVWVAFAGRFGNQQFNTYQGFTDLGKDTVSLPGVISKTLIDSKIPGELKRGNGPSGVSGRSIANVLRPAFPGWPGILCVHRGSSDNDLWWCLLGVQQGRAQADQAFTAGNKSQSAPALAKYQGKVYCVHRGASDDRLWWSTFDPVTALWSGDQAFPNHNSANPPALAVLGDTLYCVHRGKPGDGHLYWCQFDSVKSTWLGEHRLPNHSSLTGPAVAVHKQKLFCVHRGDDKDTDLWWTVFDGGEKKTWGADNRFPNHRSAHTPALAVFEGQLYCAHTGVEGDLWWCVYDDATNSWGADHRADDNRCSGTVALATVRPNGSLRETLYCVHQGKGDDKLWLATFDPQTKKWSGDREFPGNHTRDGAAVLADWL